MRYVVRLFFIMIVTSLAAFGFYLFTGESPKTKNIILFAVCLSFFLEIVDYIKYLRNKKRPKKNLFIVCPTMEHYKKFLSSDVDIPYRGKYNYLPASRLEQLKGFEPHLFLEVYPFADFKDRWEIIQTLEKLGATEIFEL